MNVEGITNVLTMMKSRLVDGLFLQSLGKIVETYTW